jgi:hypothetical protein
MRYSRMPARRGSEAPRTDVDEIRVEIPAIREEEAIPSSIGRGSQTDLRA